MLTFNKTVLSVSKNLFQSMLLAADRIVKEEEWDREDTSDLKLHVMSARRNEGDARLRGFPALELSLVEIGWILIAGEVSLRIIAPLEPVIDRNEIENFKINAVVTRRIDPADRILQRYARPRAFTNFVRVVMNKPIGLQFGGEVLFADAKLQSSRTYPPIRRRPPNYQETTRCLRAHVRAILSPVQRCRPWSGCR